MCRTCSQVIEFCELCDQNFDLCSKCISGYTPVLNPVANINTCKKCQDQFPGCASCAQEKMQCDACGVDNSGSELYLYTEAQSVSCTLCDNEQMKKDISEGKSEPTFYLLFL